MARLIKNRPYGYARVHCVIGKSHDLSLEVISNINDYNEVTNHWLNVVTAKCIRKLGPLTEDDLKGAEVMETAQAKLSVGGRGITAQEKGVIETIERMKRDRAELVHEEIYDQLEERMEFREFEKLIKDMINKKIIRATSDKHYDIY